MNKLIAIISVINIILCSLFLCTGCSQEEKDPSISTPPGYGTEENAKMHPLEKE